ncbi:LacI family transcriptional regulator [Catenovulum agarivorans DS-2]|uniref:LacI family transcriptional regulator n=1 Tax=Catenovulum agarivorans DS-2 TaxID=1328313 RepID=W7QWP1_9ALTE|nr:LacI family DNA-binding transcriptional regulator [Catenovulum agarivorans]EWH12158.1 LacI family transcriptional regulator [Catenovulum agarivorans DS-2]
MARMGIKQIAALAGVSIATVSRTLRNPEIVSEQTRNKVQKAIDESGYKPNKLGASLRTHRSGNVVAIIPDVTDPFNSGIICAIEQQAQKLGYSVLLGDTQNDKERAKQYAEMAEYGQADGIILFSHELPFNLDPNKNVLEQLPPLINASEATEHQELPKVLVDNYSGACQATQHLIDLGHKRIAIITGPLQTNSTQERLRGYKDTLFSAGIAYDEQLVCEGDYHLESGMNETEKLLLLKDRPTAIFCFCDDMAIGASKVLKENGYNIPADVSLVGFNDIRYATYMTPALTTVRQPVAELGRIAMLQLHQLLNKAPADNETVLPVELIVRQSTGPNKTN